MEGERLESHPQEESKEPKSLPVAGAHQEQGQNLAIQYRADKLKAKIFRFLRFYAFLSSCELPRGLALSEGL